MKSNNYKLDLQMFAEGDPKEEKPADEEAEEEKGDEKSLAETIKDIKENTVPKEKYEALEQEMKDFVKSVVNGDGLKSTEPDTVRKVEDIRKELFNENGSLTNLEFAKDMLDLRKQLMKEGKPDPFLPTGTNVEITSDDIAKAKNLAECLEHCVEYADGDSETFTTELMRITKDVQLPKRNLRG